MPILNAKKSGARNNTSILSEHLTQIRRFGYDVDAISLSRFFRTTAASTGFSLFLTQQNRLTPRLKSNLLRQIRDNSIIGKIIHDKSHQAGFEPELAG